MKTLKQVEIIGQVKKPGVYHYSAGMKLKDLIEHPQLQALGMVHQLGDQFYLRAPWSTPWGYPELQSIKFSGND